MRRSATGSEEISEDHQVAEEDMGSFIKHRNAYLDDEIQTESQLFKASSSYLFNDLNSNNQNLGKIQGPIQTKIATQDSSPSIES